MTERPRTFTVGEVAAYLGGTITGDAHREVTGLKPLNVATEKELSFLHRRRYYRAALRSKAGAIIAKYGNVLGDRTVIWVKDASEAYRAAIDLFYPTSPLPQGVSPQAIVDSSAHLGQRVYVGAGAVIDRGVVLGDDVTVMAAAVIGEGCTVGRQSVIHPGAVLYPGAILGERVVVHANAVIGRDGFGFHRSPHGRLERVRQVGRVVIEDDVEIGACTCVDRAALTETRVGARSKLDNLVLVGHNVEIGPDCLIIGQSGIAGSTRVGRESSLYGQVAVSGHITLGERTTVLLRGGVVDDTPPDSVLGGFPAIPASRWRRLVAITKRLPDLLRFDRRMADES